MLTNSERVRPKDKPLADVAIKANQKCRQAYSAAFALLPSQTNNLMDGLYRSQDALIAELYVGKITFGEFNIQMDRLTGTSRGCSQAFLTLSPHGQLCLFNPIPQPRPKAWPRQLLQLKKATRKTTTERPHLCLPKKDESRY
jgi:hypothetical protein